MEDKKEYIIFGLIIVGVLMFLWLLQKGTATFVKPTTYISEEELEAKAQEEKPDIKKFVPLTIGLPSSNYVERNVVKGFYKNYYASMKNELESIKWFERKNKLYRKTTFDKKIDYIYKLVQNRYYYKAIGRLRKMLMNQNLKGKQLLRVLALLSNCYGLVGEKKKAWVVKYKYYKLLLKYAPQEKKEEIKQALKVMEKLING